MVNINARVIIIFSSSRHPPGECSDLQMQGGFFREGRLADQ